MARKSAQLPDFRTRVGLYSRQEETTKRLLNRKQKSDVSTVVP